MRGQIADARTLVEHARVETQNHRFSYGEPVTVESTTHALCDLALWFGEGGENSMSRPFGVSLLIAGLAEYGPSRTKPIRCYSFSFGVYDLKLVCYNVKQVNLVQLLQRSIRNILAMQCKGN
ncbi:Proteasome subunit alpha type-5 [Cardamine amara subsp. amara]|uniref:Proteasome subunit alpha type-5 n=1 Tax=Cardamine amara subsp. amara TaxID=228776 RepID=A0ABD1BQK5_CARAN